MDLVVLCGRRLPAPGEEGCKFFFGEQEARQVRKALDGYIDGLKGITVVVDRGGLRTTYRREKPPRTER